MAATPREPVTQPAGNQPGGPSGPSLEYPNASRGEKSGLNVDQERAIGTPERPVRAEDAGQLPDAAQESTKPA